MAPPRIRIPTEADFAPLAQAGLHVELHFPTPRESTTAILVLLHGMGDHEGPFAAFARAVALPGVLAIAVRGPTPVPPALLGLPLAPAAGAGAATHRHFHYGDDIRADPAGAGLDPDPGFDAAARLLLGPLLHDVLAARCGWDLGDVLLFGFGQGGSLALGLASRARLGPAVADGAGGAAAAPGTAFKGVVSIGGPLPQSMVPTVSARAKAATPVLLCRGRASELVDDDAVEAVRREFAHVEVVTWRKPDDSMPGTRDEMMPIMRFFADRLRMPEG